MKNTNHTFILLMLAIGLLFGSCEEKIIPSGNITSEFYNNTGYDRLELSGIVIASIEFSDTEESIEIETDDNVQEFVAVEQSGNTLNIYIKEVNIKGAGTIMANIKTANITSYFGSGATQFNLQDTLTTESISVNLSGISKFRGVLNCTTSSFDLSGVSESFLAGSTDNFNVNLSGDSFIGDFDFEAKKLNANLSGASEASATITDEIRVIASGTSELNYKGDPTIAAQELSGLAKLNKVD